MLKKQEKGKLLYPALLGLLSLLFFFDTLFMGKAFVFRDFYRYFYPYKKFASECIRSGVLPFWNPLSACGTPFFAGLQSQVAYPLSLIHYVLPFDIGLHLFIAVHFFLAAYFMYLLCLDLNVKRPSAFLGGLLFAFSGYMVSLVDMTSTLSSVIWLPLIFLFYRRALIRKEVFSKCVYSALAAFALLFQFLGGEPAILYGTIGILLIFTAFNYENRSGWLILPSVLVTAGLLSAFQLLPFLEFLRNSDRAVQSGELTKALNSLWSMPLSYLQALFIPNFAGDITKMNASWYDNSQLWLKSVYVGLLPVVLFIAGFFLIRKEKGEARKLYYFLYFISLVSVLLALGKNTFLYPIFYSFLPGYSSVRFPIKFVFGAVFALPVIVALVFENVSSVKVRTKNIFTNEALVFAVILLVAGDLFLNNYFVNPRVENSFYTELSPMEKALKGDQVSSRAMLDLKSAEAPYIYGESFKEAMQNARNAIYPNQNMPNGIYLANGYDSIYTEVFSSNFRCLMQTGKARYVSMLSVSRIITTGKELEKSIFTKEQDFGQVKLYKNKNSLPFCYITPNFRSFLSRSDSDKYISSQEFDPMKEAVVEGVADGVIKNPSALPINGFKVTRPTPNTAEVVADIPVDGILVLTDTYYPGWKAFIDGKQAGIYKVNGMFKGVFCNKGRHTIRFVFSPDSLVVGMWISLTALIVLIIGLVLVYRSVGIKQK